MFNQTRLIASVDAEIMKEIRLFSAWEKLCGFFTLEDIFTEDSVFCAACRCASGFMRKNDTFFFMRNVWLNSQKLCKKVLGGKFKPSYYETREIMERGKKRVIKPPTFECKVVQKVICDYLIRPLLEAKMTSTCYASVKGRGTEKLYQDIVDELNRYIREHRDFSIITADFVGYFASIDIAVLMDLLGRYIKDGRLLNLIRLFSPDEFGLSLGNELSQIPASFFPSNIDHALKDRDKIPEFRYMDDSLAIVPKDEEQEYIQKYQALAGERKLSCPDRKFQIHRAKQNLIFCKEHFVWDNDRNIYVRIINPKIISHERKKLMSFERKIKEGTMNREDAMQQYASVIGSIRHHPHTCHAMENLENTRKKTIGVGKE